MIFKINTKKLASQVRLETSQGDEFLYITALSRRGTVGYASGGISENRLCLYDLKVYDDAYVTYPFANNMFVSIFGSCPRANFRSLGIGTRLLSEFIAAARNRGISEIWGSVQGGDATQTPHLLEFYRKHGFSISDPDDECMNIAKWKITLPFD